MTSQLTTIETPPLADWPRSPVLDLQTVEQADAAGVGVVITTEHLCMAPREAEAHDATMTSASVAAGALAVRAEPMPEYVVLVLSGGLDSTVLGYLLRAGGSRLMMLSFDYGQRHRCELEYARRTAVKLTGAHRVIDLSAISGLLSGSSLTDAVVDVPDGHYTDLSMGATVVPNRNAIMLDVAVAQAVSVKAGAVAFGAHAGDHPVYPDCRPVFLNAYRKMVLLANEGFLVPQFTVLAPFIGLSKADIVTIGAGLGVPFADTWSCYKGGEKHCGTCGTCVERREAFQVAGVVDPTDYAAGEVA